MKIIFGEVGSGKTKALIKLSHETRAVILTDTDTRKKRILAKASKYELDIPEPKVYGDCLDTDVQYLVDNVKNILEKALGVNILAGTLSSDANQIESTAETIKVKIIR